MKSACPFRERIPSRPTPVFSRMSRSCTRALMAAQAAKAGDVELPAYANVLSSQWG
ncbi:hypothetical protein [Kitasatospora griseola]|uniref:hypothetical protein n=1 Tax=Kitasatospora griseola TaxID=2064 RepID=UPI00343F3851